MNLKLYLTGKIDSCEQLDDASKGNEAFGGSGNNKSAVVADSRILNEQQVKETLLKLKSIQQEASEVQQLLSLNSTNKRKLNVEIVFAASANSSEPPVIPLTDREYMDYLGTNARLLQTVHTNKTNPTEGKVESDGSIANLANPLDSRASALLCYPEANVNFVLQAFNEHVLKKLKSGSNNPMPGDKRKPSSSGKTGVEDGDKSKAAAPVVELKIPIIVIPNAMTSTITAANVCDFLINNVYVDPIKAAESNAAVGGVGAAGESNNSAVNKAVNIHDRVCSTSKLQYKPPVPHPNQSSSSGSKAAATPSVPSAVHIRIVDNPNKLTEAEWKDQVVAVFATGQAWQFKNFAPKNMFPNAPIDLFQRVLGVHVMFDDQVVNTNVSSWNCRVLKVLYIMIEWYLIESKYICKFLLDQSS